MISTSLFFSFLPLLCALIRLNSSSSCLAKCHMHNRLYISWNCKYFASLDFSHFIPHSFCFFSSGITFDLSANYSRYCNIMSFYGGSSAHVVGRVAITSGVTGQSVSLWFPAIISIYTRICQMMRQKIVRNLLQLCNTARSFNQLWMDNDCTKLYIDMSIIHIYNKQ